MELRINNLESNIHCVCKYVYRGNIYVYIDIYIDIYVGIYYIVK